jgi:4-amino-4-deoxy-L-arabinose transferase-like glycosyltransferase
MDDPKPKPSNAPENPERREEDAASLPLLPEETDVSAPREGGIPAAGGDEVIETGVAAPFSSQPVREPPEYEAASVVASPVARFGEPEGRIEPPAPRVHLPGDAAAELIPLRELTPAIVGDEPIVDVIHEPARRAGADVAAAAAVAPPRQGAFTLWAVVWIAAWAGGMWLLLDHRFERAFDWNTSYFSIAARNLVREGFVASHGGVYLAAGDFKDHRGESFYAGHPPLTAWLVYGWMRAFGDGERAVRSLPLAFTALNLLLLYALVRRVFGAAAALASVVVCSLLPMTAYYAQVVNMEPFVLTFMLGGALGYLGWARSGSKAGFLLLVVCVILGCWADWPMYVFTGLLAAMHFLRRRDGLVVATPEGGQTVERAGRPVASSLFLLVLPVVVFGAFYAWVKWNGADLSDLTDRAKDRSGRYSLLLERLTHPKQLKEWFLDLFTPAALGLAVLGAVFWRRWTRRLSLASGEAGRRAAFRVVLAMVLTQLIYTLAFPQGAWTHEFWQYYLAAPVAVLAGGLLTWLTVAGGTGRRFHWGLADRAAWAVAALIPLMAAGPVVYRMKLPVLGKAPKAEPNVRAEFVDAIRGATDPRDVILTDWDEQNLGFGVQWYADRVFVAHDGGEHDTHTLAGIGKLRERYKDRRILYLWGDGQGSESLFETLNKQFKQRPAGPAMLYVIQEPGAAAAAVTPAATRPAAAATAASTAPATTRSTAP